MTDSPLIPTLDEILKHYTKILNANKVLLKQIQAGTEAISKIMKALPEYPSLIAADGEPYLLVGQALEQLRFKEQVVDPLKPELQGQSKKITAVVAALKAALKVLPQSPIDVVALHKAVSDLQQADDPRIQAVIGPLQETLEAAETETSQRFGRLLLESLQAEGLTLEGNAPRFAVGRFGIHIESGKRQVYLLYGKEELGHAPLSIPGIISAYKKHYKEIVERKEDGEAWMADLYTAWEDVGKGKEANIMDVYRRMALIHQSKAFLNQPTKSGFKDYTRAAFIYDFDRFTIKERLTYKGLRVQVHTGIHAQTGAKSAKTLFIVTGDNPNMGTNYGLVTFAKA